ncbi:hypothetical protein KY285_026159 [Solanum tuberosum]|nr:hypothetical protein KY285_026159 [Solanum tuberosum]
MAHQTRSKSALPSLPSENRKGKRKMTNDKKIKELEEEVSDMRGWAKLLLSIDPALETNMDKSPVTS